MPALVTSFSFGLLSLRGRGGATWSATASTIAAVSAQEEDKEEDAATKMIVEKSDCWTAGSEKRMTTMIVK